VVINGQHVQNTEVSNIDINIHANSHHLHCCTQDWQDSGWLVGAGKMPRMPFWLSCFSTGHQLDKMVYIQQLGILII